LPLFRAPLGARNARRGKEKGGGETARRRKKERERERERERDLRYSVDERKVSRRRGAFATYYVKRAANRRHVQSSRLTRDT